MCENVNNDIDYWKHYIKNGCVGRCSGRYLGIPWGLEVILKI